jgi:hypothetical protein
MSFFFNKHKFVYHICVIIAFTILYFFIAKHFGTERDKKEINTIFDSFYLSATTHSTIGYGDIAPQSSVLRMTTILHIFIVLSILI